METNGLNHSVQSEQPDQEIMDTTDSTLNHNNLQKSELLEQLKEIVENKSCLNIKADVEAIKTAFYKRHKAEVELLRQEFLAKGDPEEEFKPTADGLEQTLKEYLAIYRQKREAVNKEIEAGMLKNFEIKSAIIEQIKELVNKGDADSVAFDQFKKLQQEWNSAGMVDKLKVNDLWKTYHLHVENFYNILKVNKELRDLDLRKNYESKGDLCLRVEELILNTSVINSFRMLQDLHEEWREIGPVPRELKDEQWDRFKRASIIINKRHQDYFESIKLEQLSNLNLKQELCVKVEAVSTISLGSKKEWEDATNEILEMQKLWKTIGFAPKKDNTIIYERFKSSCNDFFARKSDFFTSLKDQYGVNIEKKRDICKRAEEFKDNEEWVKTTAILIDLQKEWKTVGLSSRKESDEIWAQFRTACDTFFNRKSEYYKSLDSKYDDNLKAKLLIIEELKAFSEESPTVAMDRLKEIQARWSEIGFVSIKMKDKVQGEYKSLINALFTGFKENYQELKLERFRTKVNTIKSSSSKGSLNSDREKMQAKIKQLEADIILLENNIGFFAKSKNADAIISDVQKKIDSTKEYIKTLKEKIKIIDNQ